PGVRRLTFNLFYSVNNPPAASTFSREHGASTTMITLPPTAPAETTGQLAEKERSSQKVSPSKSTGEVDPHIIPRSPQTPTETAQNSIISPLSPLFALLDSDNMKGALKIGTQMVLTSSPFNTPHGRGPATKPTSSKCRRPPPPPNLSPPNQDLQITSL
ncbi:hypothetical protein AMECASPLE_036140, partial [Ameca splendens]